MHCTPQHDLSWRPCNACDRHHGGEDHSSLDGSVIDSSNPSMEIFNRPHVVCQRQQAMAPWCALTCQLPPPHVSGRYNSHEPHLHSHSVQYSSRQSSGAPPVVPFPTTPQSGVKRRGEDLTHGQFAWGDVRTPAACNAVDSASRTVAVTVYPPAVTHAWPGGAALPAGQVWGQPMNLAAVAPGITPPILNLMPMPPAHVGPWGMSAGPQPYTASGPPSMMGASSMMALPMMAFMPSAMPTVCAFASEGHIGSGMMPPMMPPPHMAMVSPLPPRSLCPRPPPPMAAATAAALQQPQLATAAPVTPQPSPQPQRRPLAASPPALALPLDLIALPCTGGIVEEPCVDQDAAALLSCRSSLASTQFVAPGAPAGDMMHKSSSDGFLPSLELLLWEDCQDDDSNLLSSRPAEGLLVDADLNVSRSLEDPCRDQQAQLDVQTLVDAGSSYCCDWPMHVSSVAVDTAGGGSGGEMDLDELRTIKLEELSADEPTSEGFWDAL